MENKKEITIVRCDFDGGLHMPKTCVACGVPVEEKRYEFIVSNTLGTSKVKVNFPICEDCYQADQNYLNVVPVTIIGSIAFLFSIFSLFNRPEKYPSGLYLVGGIIWLGMIVVYVTWMNIRAHRQNSEEVLSRRKQLKKALKVKKFVPFHRHTVGQITLAFANAQFAKAFKKLNKGEIL